MKTTISVADAAEKLLEKSGRPLHYKEITDLILNDCDLHGKTPYATVRSEIGTNSKFIRVAEGIYALSKWKEFKPARFAKDIAYDILKSKGMSMSLNDLGVQVFKVSIFKGDSRTVIKNAIRHDKRFGLDSDLDLVYLVEWNK